MIVNAPKEPTDINDVPGSVTAVTRDTLSAAGVRIVSDAALFAPNTFFTEFTARKSSNPASGASAPARRTRPSRPISTACRS